MGFSKEVQLTASPALLEVLPQNKRPWYLTRHLLLLNVMLIGPMLSSGAFGYDGAMVNGLQSLTQWKDYFNHPTSPQLAAINAVWPVGQLCGVLPATWISDRYGRKKPIYIGFVILALATGLQGGAQNLAMFIVARYVMGFGSSFTTQSAPILIAELSYPTHRGKMTALYNTNNCLGSVYAAWCIYGTRTIDSNWSWRIPSLLQASLSLIQLGLIIFLPESPRWLVANDRAAEANELLTRWHAGGERNSLVVEFEIAEITENIRQEREIISRSSYADLLQTPLLRRRTLIGIIVGFYGTWSGVAVISYYLTLVLDNVGITSAKSQTLINALLQVFNWIVAIISALLVDRVGRRAMFLISSIGMLVSFICMTVISSRFTTTQNQSLGRSVIAFIFIYQLFYNIAFNPLLQAYPLEIFPYALRGRGLTISLCTTYIGLTVGQAVNPIALEAIGWKYYNVFVGLLVMLVVFVFFLFPETKGKTLEEITPVSGGFEIDILDKDRG